MKLLLPIVLLAISVCVQDIGKTPTLQATTDSLGIQTRYDRFSDKTAVTLMQSVIPLRPGYVLFSVMGWVKGQDIKGAIPQTSLSLYSYSMNGSFWIQSTHCD